MKINGYDYFYWCFYNLVWKRKGDTSQERAAALMASLVLLVCYGAFFLVRIGLNFKYYNIIIETVIVLSIGLGSIVFHIWYYGKSGKYKAVDKHFRARGYSISHAKGIAISFIVFTYVFFVFSGISLGRFLNPW